MKPKRKKWPEPAEIVGAMTQVGMTHEEIAEAADVSAETIGRISRGSATLASWSTYVRLLDLMPRVFGHTGLSAGKEIIRLRAQLSATEKELATRTALLDDQRESASFMQLEVDQANAAANEADRRADMATHKHRAAMQTIIRIVQGEPPRPGHDVVTIASDMVTKALASLRQGLPPQTGLSPPPGGEAP
jgi:DNA-binding XRE family transcriptional regulator